MDLLIFITFIILSLLVIRSESREITRGNIVNSGIYTTQFGSSAS